MLNLWFIPISLAFDAFAVSICMGIRLRQVSQRQALRTSFHFGFFQFGMPVLGWFAGQSVAGWVQSFDHWIAFGLLAAIGLHMIKEAFEKKEGNPSESCEQKDPSRGLSLIVYSVATSIDALAVGFAFALLSIPIWQPATIAGVSTMALSWIGIHGGGKLGTRWGKRVDFIGGLILVALGTRILVEHLMQG